MSAGAAVTFAWTEGPASTGAGVRPGRSGWRGGRGRDSLIAHGAYRSRSEYSRDSGDEPWPLRDGRGWRWWREGGKGGKGSGGDQGANGQDGGDPAEGGGNGACSSGAGDGGGCPNHHNGPLTGAGSKGDPVDVVTGRVFTIPKLELMLRGPLPLAIQRSYASTNLERDVGLGLGWSHSLAWEVREQRRRVVLWTDDGAPFSFPAMEIGQGRAGAHGWVLVRREDGYALARGDRRSLVFTTASGEAGRRRFQLSRIEDGRGNAVVVEYDGGIPRRVIDSGGRTLEWTRGVDGRVASLAMKNAPQQGNLVTLARYRYDDRGRLIEATDADGHRTAYTYDDDGRLTSQQSDDVRYHFRYDEVGRCVETWGEAPRDGEGLACLAEDAPAVLADGHTRARGIHHCRFYWYEDGYSEVADSLTVHRYFGNEHGKLDKAVSAGAVYERTFDERGMIKTFSDPLGGTWHWQRDDLGRVVMTTDPLGRTTTIDYETDGSVSSVCDPAGGVTTVVRDAHSLSFVDPIGAQFTLKYGERGQVVETVAPNGRKVQMRYDSYGNLVERIHDVGSARELRESATFDYWGRCTSITDSCGATTHYRWSNGGRITFEQTPDGSRNHFTYDHRGNVTSLTNGRGATTRAEYGGFGKMHSLTFADGTTTTMRYNREGHLVEVRNAKGEAHRYERDAAGLVSAERCFDGRVIAYERDLLGQVVKRSDGGVTTTYEYDLAGQLVRKELSDGTQVAYTFDDRGDLIEADNGTVRLCLGRNAVGWIVEETQTFDGEVFRLTTNYDAMGYPMDRSTSLGHHAEWHRDAMSNPYRVVMDGSEVHLRHDAMGRETMRSFGATHIESKYDAEGRIVSRSVVGAGGPQAPTDAPEWLGERPPGETTAFAYRYDSASQMSEAWERSHGVSRYDYDPTGQLVAAMHASGVTDRYDYDATGNLRETDAGHGHREYAAGDRLVRHGQTELVYDARGALTERRAPTGTERYAWNDDGTLREIERPTGERLVFAYDAFARRIAKRVEKRSHDGQVRVETTRFMWDAGRLVHEVKQAADAAGNPVVAERTYCFDEHRTEPWAHRDVERGADGVTSAWYHYLNDDTGAPEALIDDKGKLAARLPKRGFRFDEETAAEGVATPIRFRGQYRDEETGLHYNWHRYYDPTLGRYISPDPIGIEANLNAFTYAGNRPTAAVDVEGLSETLTALILDKDGKVLYAGNNAAATPDSALPSSKPCAETDALGQMAADLRKQGVAEKDIPAKVKERFDSEGLSIETYKGDKRHVLGEHKKAQKGKANKLEGVNPCATCANQFKTLGIEGSVKAPNKKKGGKMKTWDGVSTWGS
ncbi:MAG: RHS repeat-associated core domain-containing protein [Polyangiaceae bacterium]